MRSSAASDILQSAFDPDDPNSDIGNALVAARQVIESDQSPGHFSGWWMRPAACAQLGTVNASCFFTVLCPNERVSNASPDAPVSFKQRMKIMRDFRDAKAMARTLRAALAAKGLKISISQSLELIAELFGVTDWNTLAAAIREAAPHPGETTPYPRLRIGQDTLFSRELELTLHRGLVYADERNHEFATLEHLLLALVDDADAGAAMAACKVDVGALNKQVTGYIDNDLKSLAIEDRSDRGQTVAFQTAAIERVVQRAVLNVKALGRSTITGADLLVAMFDETESPALWLLGQHGMTKLGAVNFVRHGPSKASGERFGQGRTKSIIVEKIKRRATGLGRKDPR
jgi:hypothetical protein